MSLFLCHGCGDTIPPNKARVHCLPCGRYDLCASCALLGTYTESHRLGHKVELFRVSGHSGPVAGDRTAASSAAAAGQCWSTLFDPETYATLPSFVDVASAVFGFVDVEGKGYLAPETYGLLLDVLEYPEANNIWRVALKNAEGSEKEHIADRTLKRYYDKDSIQYTLGFRGGNNHSPIPQSPLLTRKGFIDLWGMDVLDDPVSLRHRINTRLRKFQPTIWKQRGDVPEWVFPKAPVSYEIYSKTRLNVSKSGLEELEGTPQQSAPVTLIEPVLAGYNWTQPMVPSQLQTRLQPPATAPLEAIHYEPSGNGDEDSEAVKKAKAELEELEKSYDRQLADLKRANDLECIRAQQQMNIDTLRSMERNREFIGTIGQDRDYIIERHYYK
ncbi:unnamed protein product [Clonostachys byssicola]|uniref:ZZ-type domain-containing protein n=1 Tax=Clonostachys byssicola TaxID=160290 RepID=A0A9N9ULL6_9HYPO|nr:unnamed protein product [Clonostachys byssicola]